MARNYSRLVAALLTLCLLVAPMLRAGDSGPVIYLVRHGENVPTDPDTKPYDPALSEAGLARAAELARVLGNVNVARIFSTDLQRTRQTAAPLAKQEGLEVELYDPKKLDEFAERLRGLPGASVVVGHSDTTPELVKLLGGEPGEPIDHTEHDRLYVLIPAAASKPITLLLRYGAAWTGEPE